MIKANFVKIIAADNVSDIAVLGENANTKSHTFLYPSATISANGFVIVDFCKELCGRLHVVFGWNDCSGKIRIRLGESVYETCAGIGEKNAGNYHSLRDNAYSVVSWGDVSTSESGFRFARIDNISGGDIKISLVFAEESGNGLRIAGDFNCSDDVLNKIYKTAERTALCAR